MGLSPLGHVPRDRGICLFLVVHNRILYIHVHSMNDDAVSKTGVKDCFCRLGCWSRNFAIATWNQGGFKASESLQFTTCYSSYISYHIQIPCCLAVPRTGVHQTPIQRDPRGMLELVSGRRVGFHNTSRIFCPGLT